MNNETFIHRSFLRKFPFDYLVVDEGHTLKNPKGLRYQNLNKFQTRARLLLTGKRNIFTCTHFVFRSHHTSYLVLLRNDKALRCKTRRRS